MIGIEALTFLREIVWETQLSEDTANIKQESEEMNRFKVT